MNWAKFFAMGGHATYIWSAYAIVTVVLIFNVLQPLLYRRALWQRLRDFYRLKDKNR